MKQSLLLSLAAAILICFRVPPADAAETPTKAIAYQITGEVVYRPLHASAWRPVETGAELATDSFIRLTTGAAIGLKLYRHGANSDKLLGVVHLSQPGLFRIDSSLIRRHELGDYLLKELPEVPAEESAPPAPPYLRFFTAWERLFATLRYHIPLGEIAPKLPDLADREKLETAEALGTLEIVRPEDGRYHLVPSLPTQIEMEWKPAAKVRRYRVFLRRVGESFAGGSMITPGHRYLLPIRAEGEYEAKVVSYDYRLQSPIVRFGVGLYSDYKSVLGGGMPKGIYLAERAPAPHTTRFTALPTQEIFRWSFGAPVEGAVRFCYQQGLEEKPQCQPTEDRGYTRVALSAAGTYYWYLEATTKKGTWRSAVGTYVLKPAIASSQLSIVERLADRGSITNATAIVLD